MSLEDLKQRFGRLGTRSGQSRRIDYKGDRARLLLRVDPDLAKALRIIKLATGENKNSICEAILSKAVTSLLTTLKEEHDPQAWETITRCATRRD